MQLELAKDSDPKLKERLFQVEEMLTKAQKTLKTKVLRIERTLH
mgnify:CR=1 FL=1